MPLRRLPPPWTVEETAPWFIVRDANKQALAFVYCEDEPARRSAAKLLSKRSAKDCCKYRQIARTSQRPVMSFAIASP
jgi:hypothetical protein